MKKSLIHFMPHHIRRFHSNGQFHRTGTYAGSAAAIKINALCKCMNVQTGCMRSC